MKLAVHQLLFLIAVLLLSQTASNTSRADILTQTPTVIVATVKELNQALQRANRATFGTDILLRDGTYTLNKRLVISGNNIHIRSESGNRDKVIIQGKGMRQTQQVEILFDVYGSYSTISGVTLRNVSNHLIQVRGEKNAHHFSLINTVLLDSYEQMLKVSSSANIHDNTYSTNGRVINCHFEYTAGIGPNFYIGGIDAHGAKNWQVEGNTFKYIASPGKHHAEHAIHFWKNSSNIVIANNLIINSDRGIGLGMGDVTGNFGGEIKNNIILNTDSRHKFADAGIILEANPDALIANNFIYLANPYPNAIEYRFKQTQNTVISGNIVNKAIRSRNGGQAVELNNTQTQATGAMTKLKGLFN